MMARRLTRRRVTLLLIAAPVSFMLLLLLITAAQRGSLRQWPNMAFSVTDSNGDGAADDGGRARRPFQWISPADDDTRQVRTWPPPPSSGRKGLAHACLAASKEGNVHVPRVHAVPRRKGRAATPFKACG